MRGGKCLGDEPVKKVGAERQARFGARPEVVAHRIVKLPGRAFYGVVKRVMS